MRWARILLVGTFAPVGAFVVLMLVAMVFWKLSAVTSNPIPVLAKVGDLVSFAGLVVAAFGMIYFGYRLWAWEKGHADRCATCDGPLGRLRTGKLAFGRQLDEYRSCYNCGKPNTE
jgi:protein-S-isoprenylcysteine O-methyltransferase Ste14